MSDRWLLTDGKIPGRDGGVVAQAFPSTNLVYHGDASFFEPTHVDGESVQNDPWPDEAGGPYEFVNADGFMTFNADAFANGYPSVEQQARDMRTGAGVTEFLDTTACTFFMLAYMPDDGNNHLLFSWNEDVLNTYVIRMQTRGTGEVDFIHGTKDVGDGYIFVSTASGAAFHRDAFHIFEFVKREDLTYEFLVDGAVEASGSFGVTGSTIPAGAAGNHPMAIFKRF